MAVDIKEEIANYLLNNCFLMGTVDTTREKYYYVINHEESFRQIFLPIGYTLVVHRNLRVIQLINNHGSGRVILKKYESIILLILRLLYVEKRESLSTSEDRVLATVEEIKNEYPDKVEEMRNDWRNFKVDKGESINEMMLRTAKKMDEIISGHKDKKILVVAHAGVIQALISYYLFGNLDGYWKFRIDNGSMTKMHIMEDGYTYFEYINLTQ